MTAEWDEYRRGAVRKWLRSVRACVSRVRAIEADIRAEQDAYDMLHGQSYDGTHAAPPVHGDDSIAAHVIHLADLMDELSIQDAEWREVIQQAHDVFARLTCHPCACEVMSYRWLRGWTWERVADEVGYSVVHVKEISAAAELECYDLIPAQARDPIPRADG